MHSRSILAAAVLATLATASNLAGAVDQNEGKNAAAGNSGIERMDKDHEMMRDGTKDHGMMQDGTKGGGMMQRGMMRGGMMQGGMMDMMTGCKQMMSSPTMSQLPPGNEKLQLQMQAEMMQKMGEILGRYADKVK
ncbi:MAG: hypothetical protein ABI349_11345 [Casimicrobiaceae bacterium]